MVTGLVPPSGGSASTSVLWGDATWRAITSTSLSDFDDSVYDRMVAVLVAGSNITLTPNSGTGTITIASSGGGGIADGDKGDITVSSSGSVWTIDTGVVDTTKLGGDITAAGIALLDDADASAQRTTLGLGTAATSATGDFAAASHSHAISDVTGLQTALDNKVDDSQLSAFGGTLIDDADASAARTTLGLGSLATQSGTFSGTSSGTNTGDQNLFGTIVVSGQSDVVADSTSDTLTLVAGSNITITTNAGTDSITINATGGGTIGDADYGDITVSGSGTVMTIDNDAVTYAKLQNISATDRLLGRDTAAAGNAEELTVGGGIEFTGSGGIQTSAFTGDATKTSGGTALTLATVNANVGSFGSATAVGTFTVNAKGLITAAGSTTISVTSSAVSDFTEAAQDATGAMVDTTLVYTDGTPLLSRAALTGDVTASVGSNATTIANNAVSLAKMADMATASILGRNTAGTGDPEVLSAATTKTLLSLNNVENTALSTWVGTTNLTTLGTIGTGSWNATNIPLGKGGTGVSLTDPGADRLMFWDDSAGNVEWLTLGTNLSITGTTINASGGGGLADADYGDITVSGSGTVMTIDNDVVTYAKMQNVSATDKLLGRSTAGSGDVEEIACTAAGRALLDDADAAAQRTTLGLGTADSPQFTAVNIGAATDTTITRTGAGDIAVEGNSIYRAGGTDVPLADGGTGASLSDPGADRILFWDDSAGAMTWLTPGSNLTVTGTTIDASGGGGGNSFQTIVVSGQSDVVADSSTDTLTLVAGTNITLTTDASTDTVTITAASGSDPWTYLVLTGDVTTTSTTASLITGLEFTPDDNSNYEYRAMLLLETATATVGGRAGFNWPTAGITRGAANMWAPNSTTASAQMNSTYGINNSVAASTGFPNANEERLLYGRGLLITTTGVTGTMKVTFASETGGTTITAKAGSYFKYRKY
jgi:hypothetical protein